MKRILFFVLAFVSIQTLYAQRGNFVITYSVALPSGDLSEYIDEVSFRGIGMEFYKRQQPNLDIGLETGWNVFYKKEASKVYTDGTASISGVQYRYTNSVPILAAAKFYTKAKSTTMGPFVGLGLGTLYSSRATDFGLYRIIADAWQFCVRPELGILFKSKNGPAGTIGAKYYWAMNSDALDGQSYFSINVGISFPSGL